jgi:hypothetical protein
VSRSSKAFASSAADRLAAADWPRLTAELDQRGVATLPRLLVS